MDYKSKYNNFWANYKDDLNNHNKNNQGNDLDNNKTDIMQ